MNLKEVWIKDGCIACGLCEDVCPEVFRVEDMAFVNGGVIYADYAEKIKEAAEGCPEGVIKHSEW